MIYDAFNYAVFDQIPSDASTILDVGCGSGTLGKKLKENRDCQVVGITHSQEEADLATKVLDSVIVANLNEIDTSTLGQFDCIIIIYTAPQLVFLQLMDFNLY
jgi:2-polyprenyl-3-methyl-5-hydroxy-6-metoxy-1,4-benzoquinol methylase